MSNKQIIVTIGGKEYSLVGEDDSLILKAADQVNQSLNNLIKNHGELPGNALPVLTALNLAESNIIKQMQSQADIDFVIDNLTRMADYLRKNVMISSEDTGTTT